MKSDYSPAPAACPCGKPWVAVRILPTHLAYRCWRCWITRYAPEVLPAVRTEIGL